MCKSRRRIRKERAAASAAEVGVGNVTIDLKQIGVERITELSRQEEARLRLCASGGAKEEKRRPARERLASLPDDISQALSDDDLVLLRCKANVDGMQPGRDFKNLRILLHLTSKFEVWNNGVTDHDFYEYSIQDKGRFLLSRRAFEALEEECTQVRASLTHVHLTPYAHT